MTRLYSNNFSTTLNGAIDGSTTTVVVTDATGLPAIGSGETCRLSIDDGTNVEIIQATAVTSNTLTVVRAQEGTSGTAFADTTTIELRSTAASFIDPNGVIDFGGADSLEIPNSATPTVDADGEIAVDNTVADFSAGLLKYYSAEEMGVVAMPIAQFTTPTDGYVVSYNATNDEFELVAGGGGGTPGGADTQVQYNDGGAFGGDAGFTTDKAGSLTLSTSLIVGPNATAGGSVVLYEDSDNGANTITIKAPLAVSATYNFELPNAGPSNAYDLIGYDGTRLAFQTVNDVTENTSPSLTDSVLSYWGGGGVNRRVQFGNFPKATTAALGIASFNNTYFAVSLGDVSINDIYLSNTGDVGTGVYDFGGASSFEIPNSASPTVNADGEIAIDTTVTDFSHGVMKYYGGEEIGVVAMPIAEFTSPTDGHVVTYNATNDEFELAAGGASVDNTFRATQASAQSITASAQTKVQFDTETWDTNSDYDSVTNYRFTPTDAGKYRVSILLGFTSLASGKTLDLSIYKNGSQYSHTQPAAGGAAGNSIFLISDLVDFNGSTDYIEAYVLHNDTVSRNTLGGVFAAEYIGP